MVNSIKPKVHSQTLVLRRETMVLWEIFVKKSPVNFVWMDIENLDHTHTVLFGNKYKRTKRLKREVLPYTCHLTCIFKHYKVSFDDYSKEKVKEWFVRKISLKNMKIYMTTNHRHMFWLYMRDSDTLGGKCDSKLKKEQQVFLMLGAGFKENPD